MVDSPRTAGLHADLRAAASRAFAGTRGRAVLPRFSAAAVLAVLIALVLAPAVRAEGYLDFFLTTRTFEAPLFGDRSVTVFRLFASQKFERREISVWYSDGFPELDETFTASLDERDFRGGRLGLELGDVALIDPGGGAPFGGGLPLEGVSASWRGEGAGASFSLGRTRYPVRPPGRDEGERPSLFAGALERGTESAFARLGIVAIDRSLSFSDPDGGSDLVLTPGFARRLTLSTQVFADAPVSLAGGVAYRAGARWDRLAYGLEASAYGYPDEFPLLLPLFRPGEAGTEVAGRYAPDERTLVRGVATFIRKNLAGRSDDFRGRLVVTRFLRPQGTRLMFLYDHNQYQYRGLDEDDPGGFRNRLSVSLASNRFGDQTEVRLDHESGSGVTDDRTQAAFRWGRRGERRSWNGDALIQREGDDDTGASVESALLLPWRGLIQLLVGGAATWSDRNEADAGQAAIRLGIVRRHVLVEGWSGAVEIRVPVSVGLSPVDSGDVQLAASIGNRFAWEGVGDILPRLGFFRADRGSIEGTVRTDEGPIGGVAILIDGQPVTHTGADGSFRINRVEEGPVAIEIDVSRLDPSLAAGGAQVVNVVSGETARVDFLLSRGYFLQGVVLCRDTQPAKAVGNVAIALVGETVAYRTTSSAVGGFQFANVRPGTYQLLVDAATGQPRLDAAALEPMSLEVDADRTGIAVNVPCAATAAP